MRSSPRPFHGSRFSAERAPNGAPDWALRIGVVFLPTDDSTGNVRRAHLCRAIWLLVQRDFRVICREDGADRLVWRARLVIERHLGDGTS